jgi:hypothetical protein
MANDTRIPKNPWAVDTMIDLTNFDEPGPSRLKPAMKKDEVICLDSDLDSSDEFEETVRKILDETPNTSLFFVDRGTEVKNTEVPIYTITTGELGNLENTLILNKTASTCTLVPESDEMEDGEIEDDSVVFVNEEKLNVKPVENPFNAGSPFIPLPVSYFN